MMVMILFQNWCEEIGWQNILIFQRLLLDLRSDTKRKAKEGIKDKNQSY